MNINNRKTKLLMLDNIFEEYKTIYKNPKTVFKNIKNLNSKDKINVIYSIVNNISDKHYKIKKIYYKKLKYIIFNELDFDYENLVTKLICYIHFKKNLKQYERNVFICSLILYNPSILLSDIIKLKLITEPPECIKVGHYYIKNTNEIIINGIIYKSKQKLDYDYDNNTLLFPIKLKTACNIIKSCFGCNVNTIKHSFITKVYTLSLLNTR